MSSGLLSRKLRWLCAPLAFLVAGQGIAFGQAPFGSPGPGCCQTHHCPPPYRHCMEGPPKIKVKKGCPRPVCDPCNLAHWGYFQTCWRPWPYPPDWSHCPFPTPAATVIPPPGDGHAGILGAPSAEPPTQLPAPRPVREGERPGQ